MNLLSLALFVAILDNFEADFIIPALHQALLILIPLSVSPRRRGISLRSCKEIQKWNISKLVSN